MAKIRLTRVTTVEYEVNPEYYPDCKTIEEMAQLDASTDDRELIFSEPSTDVVSYEIIEN